MTVVQFNGHEYPIRKVQMPFGERVISVTDLNDALMNADGSYFSNEARFVDESIFFFLEKENFDLSENKVKEIILESI
ncbi:hypothetical protein [Winogradskyella helgolandensis]|uniref:hypothetical protein n=1 Tax=Winogradskyella helgolandensis TaxID=2697010 RepID=UPI0015CDDE99|nr:hypothetical protein [Winogradskyella helgolandensis]